MAPSLARPASPAATGSLRNAPGRGPRPDPTTLARRAHGASPGGHRIRHGHRYPPGRGPDPRHPRRLRSRSFDHRSVGRRGRRPGRTRPGGARRGVHPRDPHARGGRDLFWGRPTLVGIEPASMTAVFCHNAADRKAETWAKRLAPFGRLEFAVSDAAKGIAAAVGEIAKARSDDPSAPPLEHGLDVFHTTMEAHRVLTQHWRRAEAAWEQAEAADVKVVDAKRQGLDARGVAGAARAAWSKAMASLERAERLES